MAKRGAKPKPIRICAEPTCGRRAYGDWPHCPRCTMRVRRHGSATGEHKMGRPKKSKGV